jgi:hypothetical protein
MRYLVGLLTSVAFLAVGASARAVVVAGNDPTGPSMATTYSGNSSGGFTVVDNVSYNPAAGTWNKGLRLTDGTASGNEVPINETVTNAGPLAWTGWHEQVFTTTNVNNDPNYPDFLFRNGSLTVSRNGVPLTQGANYTLVTDSFFNRSSSEADWRSVSILLNPASDIQVGDTLGISERIYEVFGDADTWMPNEIALVGQNPTAVPVPEPSALALAALGALALSTVARRRCTRTYAERFQIGS